MAINKLQAKYWAVSTERLKIVIYASLSNAAIHSTWRMHKKFSHKYLRIGIDSDCQFYETHTLFMEKTLKFFKIIIRNQKLRN